MNPLQRLAKALFAIEDVGPVQPGVVATPPPSLRKSVKRWLFEVERVDDLPEQKAEKKARRSLFEVEPIVDLPEATEAEARQGKGLGELVFAVEELEVVAEPKAVPSKPFLKWLLWPESPDQEKHQDNSRRTGGT